MDFASLIIRRASSSHTTAGKLRVRTSSHPPFHGGSSAYIRAHALMAFIMVLDTASSRCRSSFIGIIFLITLFKNSITRTPYPPFLPVTAMSLALSLSKQYSKASMVSISLVPSSRRSFFIALLGFQTAEHIASVRLSHSDTT